MNAKFRGEQFRSSSLTESRAPPDLKLQNILIKNNIEEENAIAIEQRKGRDQKLVLKSLKYGYSFKKGHNHNESGGTNPLRQGCRPLEDCGGGGRGRPVDESAAKETKGGDVRNESHHTLSLFPRSHPSIHIRTMVRKNRADSGEGKQNRTLQKEGVREGVPPSPCPRSRDK
ncbi:hypothetical protein NPIL_437251 [Nephila pilipes]|uniref:Uncharacterized protein n=1 Tax=Nephila pilipes TaxID=299642 RepID=A0A8X6U8H2_NEPPI|nr:hypothetical protein NPIL_437251 [Nephila pilipes]